MNKIRIGVFIIYGLDTVLDEIVEYYMLLMTESGMNLYLIKMKLQNKVYAR